MVDFSVYTHLEERVEAIQLTPETQLRVAAALASELEAQLLSLFSATYDADAKCYIFTYRYKTDAVESVLTPGDYLIRLNMGNYVVRTEEAFLENYIHTANDPVIPTDKVQTPKGSIVSFIKAFYPDAGVNSEADLTDAALGQIAEGIRAWYDPTQNVFDIKFTDCGIVDPTGLADVMKAFPTASYIKPDTLFTLNFNNGVYNDADPNKTGNCFNAIALEQLVGELKRIDPAYRKRLIGITFLKMPKADYEPIAPSVSEVAWTRFVNQVISITGIAGTQGIKR